MPLAPHACADSTEGTRTVHAMIGAVTDTATVTVAQAPVTMTLMAGGNQEVLPAPKEWLS